MEKQIEEMAKILSQVQTVGIVVTESQMDSRNSYTREIKNREIAEHLYNAGCHKREWFDAKNHPPTESGKYIACTKDGNVFQAKFYAHPDGTGGQWGTKNKGKNITRWTYMPEPPKGE